MIVNEMHGMLVEDEELKIKVPADFILGRFGFISDGYWWDIGVLWGISVGCVVGSFVWLYSWKRQE